jgi:outer membrane protein W
MRFSSVVKSLTVLFVCGLLAGSVGLAEDTKDKWQFGFGLSFMSTSDSIRSNADIAIAGTPLGDIGLPPVIFVDPRPDDNILNEPTIEDDFKFDFSASYGLTRWLAVEMWVSYFEAPVGNIEVFITDNTVTPGDGNPTAGGTVQACGPSGTGTCYSYSSGVPQQVLNNTFVPVGELTQIPIQLSALFRFRPESPFDPYIGAGIGYIFTDMKLSSEFQATSQEIAGRTIAAACGGEISFCGGSDPATAISDPNAFRPEALTVEVDDAFEWHLAAGVDYYMNERFSIYVDARYSWADGQVDIKSSDFHQVEITAIDEGRLFLATQNVWDGAVGIGQNDPLFGQPYLWEDQGPLASAAFHGRCPTCVGDGLFNTEDKNGNGLYEAAEDDGVLIALPPGSFDPAEAIVGKEIFCAACAGSGPGPLYPGQIGIFLNSDTEDVNFSRSLDRFLNYGIDICTIDQGVGNPACDKSFLTPMTADRFVLPAGCPTIPPAIDARVPEGCPTPISGPSSSGLDDTSDRFLVQGGEIRFDGFSLGVGIKLTF